MSIFFVEPFCIDEVVYIAWCRLCYEAPEPLAGAYTILLSRRFFFAERIHISCCRWVMSPRVSWRRHSIFLLRGFQTKAIEFERVYYIYGC
jgi:hypothetical protein